MYVYIYIYIYKICFLQIHFEELLEKLSAHRTDVSAKLLREIKKSLLLTCVKI